MVNNLLIDDVDDESSGGGAGRFLGNLANGCGLKVALT